MQTETPRRPRPPARVRRSLAKDSTTPPSGHISTLAFPMTGDDSARDEWDGRLAARTKSGNPDDDLAWLNEKSRDELAGLLVEADSLIKERESGMRFPQGRRKT